VVGLKVGDPVMIAGVNVGKVTVIRIDQGRVRTDFEVLVGTVIKEDSTATVGQTSLLGGNYLGVDFGSKNAKTLPPGGVIIGRDAVSIAELLDSFNRNQNETFAMVQDILQESREPFVNLLQRLESVITKVDNGQGTIGRLVNNDEIYVELNETVSQLRQIVTGVREGKGTLGQLVVDQGLYDNANATAAQLKIIAEKINAGEGTIGKLVNDDAVYTELADALADIRTIVAKVNQGEGSLGKLVNDPALYDQATATASRANSILTKVDNGQGTLGRLLNEDGLYRKTEATLNKVDRAVGGLSDSGPMSALGTVIGTFF
jgi:phospholipid/cholesterol/gamma-HCH transport system substrate-binding protein